MEKYAEKRYIDTDKGGKKMTKRIRGRMAKVFSSMKAVFLSTFVFAFIVPSLVMVSLLYISFLHQTQIFHARQYHNTLQLLSSQLSGNINMDKEVSMAYFYDDKVKSFYTFVNNYDIEQEETRYNQCLQPYNQAITIYMTLLDKNIEGIGFVPVSHNSNRYFYIPKYQEPQVFENYHCNEKNWYPKLAENSNNIIFVKTDSTGNEDSISMIRAAKNVDKGQSIGYIVVNISTSFLEDMINELSVGKGSSIMLLSPDQQVLYTTDAKMTAYSDLIMNKDSVHTATDRFDVFRYTDQTYGFTFCYMASAKDMLMANLSSFWIVCVFYLIMVAAAYVAYKRMSRRITKSVNPIIDVMNQYNAGDSSILCDTSLCTVSEIATISENLNLMIRKINDHIDNEYKLQLSQKAAEYQALQAEIDPHFLYNTLNLFITLNRLDEKKKLENAIISLSHLFQYTCRHTGSTTIRQEFDFVKDYLYLQQIRYDDRLKFEFYLEPDMEDFEIPKLLIQPLVENVIVHALEPSDHPVNIQITAMMASSRYQYQFAVVSVVNTGGMPYRPGNADSGRTGIKNIRDRLAIFNPNAIFSIRGGDGKPTKCSIIIPVELKTETVL